MERCTLRDAEAWISETLDRVGNGEDVEIVRRGAKGERFRILAVGGGDTPRKPGAPKGKIVISEEFDDEAASLTAAFEVLTLPPCCPRS